MAPYSQFMNTTKFIQVPDVASATMDYLKNDADDRGELVTLNVGPSHPATHGVLRLKLVIDGEEIVSCDPVIGYLHRGMEKIAENCHYNQFVTYTDRTFMAEAPAAWRLHISTSRRDRTFMALFTVLGMSCRAP